MLGHADPTSNNSTNVATACCFEAPCAVTALAHCQSRAGLMPRLNMQVACSDGGLRQGVYHEGIGTADRIPALVHQAAGATSWIDDAPRPPRVDTGGTRYARQVTREGRPDVVPRLIPPARNQLARTTRLAPFGRRELKGSQLNSPSMERDLRKILIQ